MCPRAAASRLARPLKLAANPGLAERGGERFEVYARTAADAAGERLGERCRLEAFDSENSAHRLEGGRVR